MKFRNAVNRVEIIVVEIWIATQCSSFCVEEMRSGCIVPLLIAYVSEAPYL